MVFFCFSFPAKKVREHFSKILGDSHRHFSFNWGGGGGGRQWPFRDEKSFFEESSPLSHKVRLTLYSYLVSLCPVSDLFGKRELILYEA